MKTELIQPPTTLDGSPMPTLGDTPRSTFRAELESALETLRRKLLQRELSDPSNADFNAPIRRAANEAAAMARETGFPLLVFPSLFEERATLAKASG